MKKIKQYTIATVVAVLCLMALTEFGRLLVTYPILVIVLFVSWIVYIAVGFIYDNLSKFSWFRKL